MLPPIGRRGRYPTTKYSLWPALGVANWRVHSSKQVDGAYACVAAC